MLEELFFEIGIILIIAAAVSVIVYRLRFPLIIAYIITGILVGPAVFHFAENTEIFNVMSEIGVAFLLFTVGLGLNWKNVKDVGGISLATGIGQVLFTTIIGFGIGLLLGFDTIHALYLAIALTFSSTIIIVKVLSDKEDTDSLYGRISIGLLLVQDFLAMLILLGLDAMKSGASMQTVFVGSLLKALIIIPFLWLLSNKILPKVLSYIAKSQELLFIFAIAWCFLIAGVLVFFGFGVELGALIAGVTLSGTFYHREINARIKPLRDFFLIIFFIMLGAQLGFDGLLDMWLPILVFSLFVLIGNPLIVLFIMRMLGYHPRTGFLTGTAIAQISEFSFIVIVAGIAAGHIDQSILIPVTAIGIITIGGSSILIDYNEKLFEILRPALRWLEPKHTLAEEKKRKHKPRDILLFGYHNQGAILLNTIKKMGKKYVIVDFDPQIIRDLVSREEPVLYGDVSDDNFLEEIHAHKSSLIISTIPDVVVSTSILMFLKSKKYKGIAVVAVHNQAEAERCYELGASYVIIPDVLTGNKFSEMLKKSQVHKRSWKNLKEKY
jgi:Kef-type K+ transport system membrane component KefB/voltage-gated potassium channel Kch